MSNKIERDIYVLRDTSCVAPPIEYVQGTDMVPILLHVRDYKIPENAVAIAYAAGKSGETKKALCDVNGNEITFTPEDGFFEEGRNVLQVRVTSNNKNLFAFKYNVRCQDNIATDDAEEVESQPTLLTQVLTEISDVSKLIDAETSARKVAVANEKLERQAEIAVERERINNLTRAEESGMSTDAERELGDVRVAFDGTVYDNAGEAVRGQVGQLSSEIDNLHEVANLGHYEVTKENSIYASIKVLSGNKLKIVNNTNATITITTSSTNGVLTTVETLGDVIANSSGEFNIALSADYICVYSRADGTVDLENLSARFPAVEKELANASEQIASFGIVNYDLIDGYYIDTRDISANYIGTPSALWNLINIDCKKYRGMCLKVKTWAGANATWITRSDTQVLTSGKNIGGSFGEVEFTIEIPSDATNVRISCLKEHNDVIRVLWSDAINYLCEKLQTCEEKIKATELENMISTFDKILCIGDSLTEGVVNINVPSGMVQGIFTKYSYPTQLTKLTGVETTNKGDAGKSCVQWLEAHENDDLSGHDCCIIALGVNNPFRGYTQDEEMQAYQSIVNKVKTENKGIKIFICTITPAYCYSENSNYQIYIDFNNALISTFENVENCYILDITNCSEIKQGTPYVLGHFTALGYQKCAREKIQFINEIMNEKASEFNKIQFIGTDYDYQ